jgi:putative flippase GtrA
VGACATLLHYAIMALLASLCGVAALPASQCGFLAGGVLSYALNRAVTFRAPVAHRRALPRYVLATLVGWCVNGVALALLQALVGSIWMAQAGASAAVAIISFMLQRRIVFAGSAKPTHRPAPPGLAP